MSWSELRFGKHIGKTLPQVVFADPDWFFWAYEASAFRGTQRREADLVFARATHIRIPQRNAAEELVAEYMVHPTVMKFGGVELVPKSRPKHEGATPTFRSAVLDMSVPRKIAAYDKFGCKRMIDAVKQLVIGNPKARMNKDACEAFFDDLSRFTKTA